MRYIDSPEDVGGDSNSNLCIYNLPLQYSSFRMQFLADSRAAAIDFVYCCYVHKK